MPNLTENLLEYLAPYIILAILISILAFILTEILRMWVWSYMLRKIAHYQAKQTAAEIRKELRMKSESDIPSQSEGKRDQT